MRGRAALLGLVLLRAALDLALLAGDPLRFKQWEDSFNATVGRFVWATGRWDLLLPLQYKAFCGGCTVHAVTAAPALALFGDRFLVWKALAVLWNAVTLVVGFVALDRGVNRAAAWLWAALFATPALGLAELSLMRWGNHAETALGVVTILALLPAARPFWLGLALGALPAFCRTGLYAVAVLAPLALLRPDRLRVLAGAALGAAWMAVPAGSGDWGAYHMGVSGNLLPQGAAGAWDRLETLLVPDALGVRGWRTAPAAAWAALAALLVALPGLAVGARPVLGLLLAWVGAFAVTGFAVFITRPWTPLTNSRYHSPWLFLITLAVAAGAGVARARGWRGWWLGPALLLAANLVAWGPRLAGLAPGGLAWRLQATDLARFGLDAGGRLPDDALAGTAADPAVQALLDRLAGQRRAAALAAGAPLPVEGLSAPGRFGLGQGLAPAGWSIPGVNAALAALPADAAADIGRGYAYELAMRPGARPDSVPGVLARVRALTAAGWTGPGESPLVALAGPWALDACRGRQVPSSPDLAGCLRALPDAALTTAGMAWMRPDRDPAEVGALVDALGPAFARGVADPAAGLDEPLGLHRVRGAVGPGPIESKPALGG